MIPSFPEIKPLAEAALQSTCQKRVTVCELYADDGSLIARESNRCYPEGGICTRMGVNQSKRNYSAGSDCNWTHAEIMALRLRDTAKKPHRAIVYGHDFVCGPCEVALRDAGVQEIELSQAAGGLR